MSETLFLERDAIVADRAERTQAEWLERGRIAATIPVSRHASADVRNPLLALPAVAELQALPIDAQIALRGVLKAISADARNRAEKCWRTHKAPMAAYWKAVAVYANHTSRLLAKERSVKPTPSTPSTPVSLATLPLLPRGRG